MKSKLHKNRARQAILADTSSMGTAILMLSEINNDLNRQRLPDAIKGLIQSEPQMIANTMKRCQKMSETFKKIAELLQDAIQKENGQHGNNK